MTAYLTTRRVERFDPAGSWVDITKYVKSDIDIETGMRTERYDDRMASVGSIGFTLNDNENIFDLDTNIAKGVRIRVTLKWYGLTKIFFGLIESTTPPVGTYGDDSVNIRVNVLDWMQVAVNFKLRNIVIQTSKRIDQVMSTLLTGVTVKPLAQSIQTGKETFNIVFDAVKMGKSTLYGEIYNFLMSELGYAYITNNGTFKIENANARSGLLTLPSTSYAVPTTEYAQILDAETGGALLNGEGGAILYSEVDQYVYDGVMDDFIDSDIKHGQNVINEVDFEVKTKYVNLGVGEIYQIYTYNLYTASPPIPLPSLSTLTLRGNYWDELPNIKNQIDAAMDVVTPVYPTHFSISTGPAGAAQLSLNFVGGSDGWKWEITNNGPSCNLTYMEFDGRPIKNKQTLNHVVGDAPSQQKSDIRSMQIKQPYKESLDSAREEADKVIDDEKDGRLVVKSVTLNANKTHRHMAAFMLSDIGVLRSIQMIKPAIDKYYFIQGMNIKVGNDLSVNYSLNLREHYSFRKGLTPLAIQFNGWPFAKNVVHVNPMTRLKNLTTKTISVKVYTIGVPFQVPLVSMYDGTAGHELWIATDGSIRYYHQFSGSWAEWRTPAAVVNPLTDEWMSIIVSYNNSSTANDPVIYLNGVSQTITELTAPSGTHVDDSAIALNIGNRWYSGNDRPHWFDGLMKDVTYYSSILSQANVDVIVGSMNDPLAFTTNMLFQLFGAKTELLSQYLDVSIPATRKLIDNVYQIRASLVFDPPYPMIGRDPTLVSY